MSKKKNRPSNTVEPTTSEAAQSPDPNQTAAPSELAAPATLPLHAEIAAFLARREELSRKVADEIAATELKLAELRQTAALLASQGSEPAAKELPAKDRKPKKLKLKSASPAAREEKPAAGEPPMEAVA
jgi:hypothetical protein